MIVDGPKGKPLENLNQYEKKIFSQSGEDGIIEAIIKQLGIKEGFFVEIGTENGRESNCRNLLEKHTWRGLMIDCSHNFTSPILHRFDGGFLNVQREFVTRDNIKGILYKYNVPKDLDLLSIDIDGNDYWVLGAILRAYRPKIIVAEYNSQLGTEKSIVAEYDPNFVWDWTYYYGMSIRALGGLGKGTGYGKNDKYTIIACDSKGVNAFLIRDDLIEGNFEVKDYKELFKPCGFGPIGEDGKRKGHGEAIKKKGAEWVKV